VAAEDRASVGGALHVELECVDAPGEQQVVGVDRSALDGGADAAPAAARVGGVDEPAVQPIIASSARSSSSTPQES